MPEQRSPSTSSLTISLGLGDYRLASDLLRESFNYNNNNDYDDYLYERRLTIGDLIEIDRTLYVHWAVYVGNGQVVHIIGEDGQEIPDTEFAIVQEANLLDVALSSYVRINNKEVPAKERCLIAFPNEVVVANARKFIGHRLKFNLLTKNVEHYITEWKYGKSWSDQATMALNAIKTLKKDSSSAGHAFLVNGLNTLLNSPGANLPSSPQFPRSPSYSLSSTTSSSSRTSSTGSQTEPVS